MPPTCSQRNSTFSCQFGNYVLCLFPATADRRWRPGLGAFMACDPLAGRRRHRGPAARKQMAPQVLEKARFAEENGSRREVDTDLRIFFELQKNEVKRLKSLSRAQNYTLASRL